MKQETVKKIMRYSFYVKVITTKRIQLCLKSRFQRWLRPSLSLVTNLIPFGEWQWKTLLGEGLINFKTLFLKTLYPAEFLREWSSLFHSKIAGRKNMVLKKLCSKLKEGTSATCLAWYGSLWVDVSLVK